MNRRVNWRSLGSLSVGMAAGQIYVQVYLKNINSSQPKQEKF